MFCGCRTQRRHTVSCLLPPTSERLRPLVDRVNRPVRFLHISNPCVETFHPAAAGLNGKVGVFGACMNSEVFRDNILELIRRTSAFLPPDVENVITLQRKLETAGSKADFALELVAQNIGLAKARSL